MMKLNYQTKVIAEYEKSVTRYQQKLWIGSEQYRVWSGGSDDIIWRSLNNLKAEFASSNKFIDLLETHKSLEHEYKDKVQELNAWNDKMSGLENRN